MRNKNFISLLIASIVLTACLFDSDFATIVNDYEVGWIDIPKTRSITRNEQVVPPYVSEVGHNEKYIIAKQHPYKSGQIDSVYFDSTNYFIIEITSNFSQDKPAYGPLNKNQFDSLSRNLSITNLKFDMFYPEWN